MSKLPDTWQEVKLKDIATFSQGLQVAVEEQVSTPIDNYVRFIRIVDYTQKNEDIRFVENKGQRYFASKSDIVMVRYGTPGLVGRGIEGIIANNLFKNNLDQKIANNDFFEHLLKSSFVQNKLQSGSASTTMPAINFSTLNTVVIPLPPIEEQKKIADILSTVDKKIAFVEENINATEELKKGLMQKLLTEGIGHTEFKDTKIGKVPSSWEVLKLVESISIMTDYVANGSFASLAENVNVYDEPNYAIYVRLFDLRKGLGHEAQKYVDEDSYKFLSKSNLVGNEILIANIGANVGEAFLMPIINKPATLAPNMIEIKVNIEKLISEFLYFYLTSNIGLSELEKVTEGSGQPKINKTKLKTINVPLPSLKEQSQIIEILSTVDKKIENLKEKKQSFEELKKGLMQKLLTGEVRV